MDVNRMIEGIEDRYNADNDIIPNAPLVTWADYELLELIKYLLDEVEDLQKEVSVLLDEIN